jgi:hypothetical protein
MAGNDDALGWLRGVDTQLVAARGGHDMDIAVEVQADERRYVDRDGSEGLGVVVGDRLQRGERFTESVGG